MAWVKLPFQDQWQTLAGVNASGYVLKCYIAGTTTNTPMAIDKNGSTTINTCTLNADGFPEVSGNEVTLYIDRNFKFAIYRNSSDAAANTNAFYGPIDNVQIQSSGDQFDRLTQTTYAALRTALTNGEYAAGDIVSISSSTTPGINGQFTVCAIGSYVDNGGWILTGGSFAAIRNDRDPVKVAWWGAKTNASVRSAIQSLTSSLQNGGTVQMEYNGSYAFTDDGNNVVIPSNITVDGNMSEITYSGSAIAFTLGNGNGITYQARLKNVILKLTDKDSTAVYLNECVSAIVSDCYIEGCTSPIDNTRTNIGIYIDGGNESSYFNHFENLDLNHMHKGFLITSTGSLDPTVQYFVNCRTLGDQTTDVASIGYHFVSNGTSNFAGQGSQIYGGNIELCNTGILMGAGAGQVNVDCVRFESNVTGTAWKVDLTTGAGPIIIRHCQGFGTTYMESNSGIRNWDAHPGNSFYGSDAAEIRLGGFDKALNGRHFIGMRDAVSGSNAPQIWFANNSDANILIDSGNTGTGRIVLAAGTGSSDTGGGFIAHSHAHASNPGCMDLFYSAGASGAAVRVTTGIGGTVRLAIDASSTRPGVDSSASLGDGTYRWTEVHADNATINTSDERYKTEIEPLIDFNDAILDAWQAVDYMKYKKLDAVEKKGDGARWHFGVIAQRVVKAFEDRGIDPFTLGPVCYDKWDEIIETHLENVLDENGNAIPKLIEMRDESGNVQLDHNGQPRMIEHGFVTREVHTVIPAGDRYGIRYEECFALESALNRREIKRLKKLILGLANQVNK